MMITRMTMGNLPQPAGYRKSSIGCKVSVTGSGEISSILHEKVQPEAGAEQGGLIMGRGSLTSRGGGSGGKVVSTPTLFRIKS